MDLYKKHNTFSFSFSSTPSEKERERWKPLTSQAVPCDLILVTDWTIDRVTDLHIVYQHRHPKTFNIIDPSVIKLQFWKLRIRTLSHRHNVWIFYNWPSVRDLPLLPRSTTSYPGRRPHVWNHLGAGTTDRGNSQLAEEYCEPKCYQHAQNGQWDTCTFSTKSYSVISVLSV